MLINPAFVNTPLVTGMGNDKLLPAPGQKTLATLEAVIPQPGTILYSIPYYMLPYSIYPI